MNNLVPLPYSRIAVQHIDTDLDDAAIRTFLRDKEAWFETDHVVFRRGRDCAVVEIETTTSTNSFCRITSVNVLPQAERTRWIDDAAVDTGNPSALAEKARASGIGASETLVVNGLYEHMNFIHRPAPLVIHVFDMVPPEPPRKRRCRSSKRFRLSWVPSDPRPSSDRTAMPLHARSFRRRSIAFSSRANSRAVAPALLAARVGVMGNSLGVVV